MVFVGVILLVLAVVFFFIGRSQTGKLDAMNAADTYSAKLLRELHAKITESVGKDAFVQPSEVVGTIECDDPLVTPNGSVPCVAYTRSVTREYEERVTSTNSDGKRETRTERKSETLESQDRRVNFYVRDETGRTLIIPAEAELELEEVHNHFDERQQPWSGATRNLGKRTTESALQLGTTVYVLGCAVDYQGQVAIAKGPSDRKQLFMVSRKSERELAGSAASWAGYMKYATAGSAIVGFILLVIGLLFG